MAATEEERLLKRQMLSNSVRDIVTSRERTPRTPQWAIAWRRTLMRYVDEIHRLDTEGNTQAENSPENSRGEE